MTSQMSSGEIGAWLSLNLLMSRLGVVTADGNRSQKLPQGKRRLSFTVRLDGGTSFNTD